MIDGYIIHPVTKFNTKYLVRYKDKNQDSALRIIDKDCRVTAYDNRKQRKF
jgi:hypothetical protein